jgi:hypothetical protein
MKLRSVADVVLLSGPVLLLGLLAANQSLAQSFTLTPTPSLVTIHPGDQNVPIGVSVTANGNTYSGPITITVAGLPSGITPSPLTLTSGGSGTLYLNASVSADQEDFPQTDTPVTSHSRALLLIGAVGAEQSTAQVVLTVSISNPSFAPSPSAINLPIVTINTNQTPIVNKTTDIPGTITITSANGQTTYLPSSSNPDNTATFHLHGNSTLFMPKLSYHVKMNTSLDLLSAMGLICPYVTSKGNEVCDKSKSYVLLANYDDKTFLRDWSASALANAIPIGNGYLNSPADSPTPSGTSTLMPWASHSLYVEMYLNGVYEGTYQLIEEVKVDNHKVNITELTESQTSGDLTGGYLMEIDHHLGEAYMFTTPQGYPIGLIDPDFSPDPEVPEQTSYITNYVDTAENALFASNYTDPNLGWRAYFDETSSINFYIVNDVMGNADGGDFYSSDYLYKNVDNPLIYMGPVWDFDISSGNVDKGAVVNPTLPWMQTENLWYQRWFTDPGYKADVITQWNALMNNGIFSNWLASIGQEAASLEQTQVNNFGRWPMQGIRVWPNAEAAGSYDGEVAYLTNWLNLRIAYLDSLFNSKTPTSTELGLPSGTLYNGTSVTLGAKVTGGTAPSGTVSFLAGGVVIGTAALNAGGVATLTTSSLPVGTFYFQAVYDGDSVNALSTSNYYQATVMPALIGSLTSIASGSTAVDTCTAVNFTVSVVGSSGTATPTGTVTLKADGSTVGSPSPIFNGVAIITATLASGTDSVQAVYSGDGSYLASSSNIVSVGVSSSCGSRLPTPAFSLPSGSYVGPQSVSISDAAPGVKIYYTTDGTIPTTSSAVSSGPIPLNAGTGLYGSSIVVQAIAVLSGSTTSSVAAALYSIKVAFAAAPAAVSATPNPASGLSNTFVLTYSDTYGAAYLSSVGVIFNSQANDSNSCTVSYSPASNLVSLVNDGATASSTITPGSGTLSNSQCTINGGGTSVVTSGNNLTLNLAVTASSTFTGKYGILMMAGDYSSASTGWVNNGTWTPAANQAPAVVSVSPNPASGPSNIFALTYSDPNGATDLNIVGAIFNATVSTTNSCTVLYSPALNVIYLVNDAGTESSKLLPGFGTISNSQCTIVGTNTSVTWSGDTLTLNLEVTASSTYTAAQNIFLVAEDNSLVSTGWVNVGTWEP